MKTLAQLFYLEALLRLRQTHAWLYPLGFFVMVMSLFPLALSPEPNFLRMIFSGCIWVAALLASLLAMQMMFYAELEDGQIEQLLLAQLPLPLVITIKLFVEWLLMALPLILLTPIMAGFYHVAFNEALMIAFSLLLGTPIMLALGGLCRALTLGLRGEGVLLSLLILPLSLPIILLAVSIVENAKLGFAVHGMIAFLAALCLFSIILTPFLIAATLRISFDD